MRISRFLDKHKGQRAFIICNGPSLNKHDLSLLKDEITFGANRIYLHDTFTPKYYSIEDWNAIYEYHNEINSWNGPEYKFISNNISREFIIGKEVVYIDFVRWNKNEIREIVNKNINIFYWGNTITFLLIQLAYYMGCNPIYIIGADHFKKNTTSGVPHFTDKYIKGNKFNPTNVDNMNVGYSLLKERLEKDGYKIYNATIGGNLEIFDRVDYNELFTNRT